MTTTQLKPSYLALSLSSLLLSPSLVLADVNTRDGAFSKSFQDFGMTRTYHSRSLAIGVFGFGWCSDWDVTLDLKTEKRGTLSRCREPKSLSVPIEKQGQLWTIKKEGKTWFFQKNGELLKVKLSSGVEVQADRDPKTQFIRELRSSRGEKIQFQFENQNLKLKNSNKGQREKYEYDELHNLTEVFLWQNHQWQVTDRISYDTGRDLTLVTLSVNASGVGCEDSFTYLRNSTLHASTIVQRKCPNRTLEIVKYQFFYESHSDGTVSLNRMAVTSESGTTRLSFNQRTGSLQLGGGLK